LVFVDTIPQSQVLQGAGIGDFDGDGKTEIAFGDMYGRVFVVENTGDNQFELVWETDLISGNAYDNFSAPDADQDGKPEFIIHAYSYAYPCCKQSVWIFEATGDNTYEVVYLDTIRTPWTDDQGPISDAGDVDGDGVPELVISGTTACYILKATGDNTYERIWYYEPPGQHLIQLDVEIYDLDNNGLNDIILSWTRVDPYGYLHAMTKIFEKGIDMEWVYPSQYDTFLVDSVETLRWVVYDTISVESLYIYLAPLSGEGRELIFVGDPLIDSSFHWTVPDTQGDFRLWLLVTGPGRRDSLSSPEIYITPKGVREKHPSKEKEGLFALPSNPVIPPLKIRYLIGQRSKIAKLKVIDVTGRVVRVFEDLRPGYGYVVWDGLDSRGKKLTRGVYFILLEVDEKRWLRRVLLWR